MRPSDRPVSEALHVPDSGLSIQEVSSLLDVPAPTIRSWERRCAVPAPARSAGGHRRYTLHDLTVLRTMRDEVARGRRPGDAAAWVRSQTAEPLPQQSVVDDLLAAAQRLDGVVLIAALDAALARHGLAETLDGVVMPTMRQVGVSWQAGRCDTAHEHLASEAVLTWLHGLPCQRRGPVEPGVAVLACGPADHHSLGLEMLAALLRDGGRDARVLGSRVPATSLVAAIRETGASAAVVVSHLASSRRSATQALTAAAETLPAVFYAGNAFTAPSVRRGVPGTYLGEDLADATDLVAASLARAA